MHPEQHTELDNVITMQHNLRTSAKGSNDAYDVYTSLTLWSVNTFARAVTKWTKACDKRLCRLISHIHHTCEFEQYCHVGNTVQQCRLGLFQDSVFAGDLEDSSTSGGIFVHIWKTHVRSRKLDV